MTITPDAYAPKPASQGARSLKIESATPQGKRTASGAVLAGVMIATVLIGLTVGLVGLKVATDAAFDAGMAAGVEYEAWFCQNEVTP